MSKSTQDIKLVQTQLEKLLCKPGLTALCAAQAYGGGNFRLVGVVLQRALLLNAMLVGIMITSWVWIEDLLLLIGTSTKCTSIDSSSSCLSFLLPRQCFTITAC